MKAKPYNWIQLKTEFILGDKESLTDFFNAQDPPVPVSTWEKKTRSWKDERRLYQEKAAQKALEKGINKRARAIAELVADADLAGNLSRDALRLAKAANLSPRDAAYVLKVAHEMKVEALKLEAPNEELLQKLGVSVGITTGTDAGEIRAEIRILARTIARGRVRRLEGGQPLLGTGDSPDSSKQAV